MTAAASLRAAACRRVRELRRSGVVAPAQVRDPGIKALQHRFRLLQGLELAAQLLEPAGQGGGIDTVLASQVLHRRDSALDLVLPSRIRVHALEVGAEFRAGFAQRDQRFFCKPQRWREPPVDDCARPQQAGRARGKRMGVDAVALVDQGERALRRLREPAAVGEPVALVDERFGLARPEPERLELADLVTQQLEPRGAVACLAREGIALLAALLPFAGQRRDRGRQARIDAVIVDNFALRVARHQRLEFLLAVDVDEQLAEGAHALRRQSLAVHVLA